MNCTSLTSFDAGAPTPNDLQRGLKERPLRLGQINLSNGCTHSTSLSYNDEQRFRDFDKVFSMLDGKSPTAPIAELCNLFSTHFSELKAGARKASDYFDVRLYRKAGTFHVFPRRKDLIDRINRIVGQHRQWLPHDRNAAPDAFWRQYEAAEKITARAPNMSTLAWHAGRYPSGEEQEKA